MKVKIPSRIVLVTRRRIFWREISEDIRKALLANVWRWKYAGSTTIVNFRGTIEGDLTLQGHCFRCGTEVTVIEGN
jgi:hypothetical protein